MEWEGKSIKLCLNRHDNLAGLHQSNGESDCESDSFSSVGTLETDTSTSATTSFLFSDQLTTELLAEVGADYLDSKCRKLHKLEEFYQFAEKLNGLDACLSQELQMMSILFTHQHAMEIPMFSPHARFVTNVYTMLSKVNKNAIEKYCQFMNKIVVYLWENCAINGKFGKYSFLQMQKDLVHKYDNYANDPIIHVLRRMHMFNPSIYKRDCVESFRKAFFMAVFGHKQSDLDANHEYELPDEIEQLLSHIVIPMIFGRFSRFYVAQYLVEEYVELLEIQLYKQFQLLKRAYYYMKKNSSSTHKHNNSKHNNNNNSINASSFKRVFRFECSLFDNNRSKNVFINRFARFCVWILDVGYIHKFHSTSTCKSNDSFADENYIKKNTTKKERRNNNSNKTSYKLFDVAFHPGTPWRFYDTQKQYSQYLYLKYLANIKNTNREYQTEDDDHDHESNIDIGVNGADSGDVIIPTKDMFLMYYVHCLHPSALDWFVTKYFGKNDFDKIMSFTINDILGNDELNNPKEANHGVNDCKHLDAMKNETEKIWKSTFADLIEEGKERVEEIKQLHQQLEKKFAIELSHQNKQLQGTTACLKKAKRKNNKFNAYPKTSRAKRLAKMVDEVYQTKYKLEKKKLLSNHCEEELKSKYPFTSAWIVTCVTALVLFTAIFMPFLFLGFKFDLFPPTVTKYDINVFVSGRADIHTSLNNQPENIMDEIKVNMHLEYEYQNYVSDINGKAIGFSSVDGETAAGIKNVQFTTNIKNSKYHDIADYSIVDGTDFSYITCDLCNWWLPNSKCYIKNNFIDFSYFFTSFGWHDNQYYDFNLNYTYDAGESLALYSDSESNSLLLWLPWINVFDNKNTWEYVEEYYIRGYCSKDMFDDQTGAVNVINDRGLENITSKSNNVRFTTSNTWQKCSCSDSTEYIYTYDELDDYFECFVIDSNTYARKSKELVVELQFGNYSMPLKELGLAQRNGTSNFGNVKKNKHDLPKRWKLSVVNWFWLFVSVCVTWFLMWFTDHKVNQQADKARQKFISKSNNEAN